MIEIFRGSVPSLWQSPGRCNPENNAYGITCVCKLACLHCVLVCLLLRRLQR